MKPFPHQESKSNEGVAVLREKGLVYFSMQERTGKTLTSILTAEKYGAKNVLVITKKKALPDFKETLTKYNPKFKWTATNYHQLNKLDEEFDLIIIDEAHAYISAFPDRGELWNQVSRFTPGKPLIYLSATPHAQGYHLMFNQLALSDYSPWSDYRHPLDWFDRYGFENSFKKKIKTARGSFEKEIPIYTETKTDLIERDISEYFVSGTREELGFTQEPEDLLHYIKLNEQTKGIYNFAVREEKIQFGAEEKSLEEKGALRAFLHQLEGGVGKDYVPVLKVNRYIQEIEGEVLLTLKQGSKSTSRTIVETTEGVFDIPIGKASAVFKYPKRSVEIISVRNEEFQDNIKFAKTKLTIGKSRDPRNEKVENSLREVFFEFFNCEKVDYILHNWGDEENLVIMYHFKAELIKLQRFFKKATLLQGTSNAEGVDLSSFDHLIIYSQDYSTSKHSQRRARQANMARKDPINVHFLLVQGAISAEVYQAVSINKENFVDNRFVKKLLK